jgi:TolB-like protein/DNA-binding winged helix-turn-helix (wHTH) protein
LLVSRKGQIFCVAWSGKLDYNVPPDGFLDRRSRPHHSCARYPRCGFEVLPKLWQNSGKVLPERMNQQGKHLYPFGSFRFDPEDRLLSQNGKPIPLGPKVAETLLLLLQNAGHLVDKDDLLKQVWPDSFVEEGSLNKNIFFLRKVLGEQDRGLQYIETIARRGYRFVAPVSQVIDEETGFQETPAEGKRLPWPRKALAIGIFLIVVLLVLGALQVHWSRRARQYAFDPSAIHSLAVLPLEDLSGDSSQDYFADGITDELITNLGQLGSLRVVSRTSVMQYRGIHRSLSRIGRELNVDAIIEGTIVRSGDRVRITAQLIDLSADEHLWAQSYEGDLRDVLDLQRQVAGAIADQIRIKLTPQEQAVLKTSHVVNPQAYELYLRGHYLAQTGSIDGYQRSIVYFNKAIEQDPHQALAYAGLADAYVMLGHMVMLPPQQAFPKAETAAQRSLQIDESLSDAHSSLGDVKFLYQWDFVGAEKEFQRALELNPNSLGARASYADFLIAMGRFDESIAQRKRNQEIGPLAVGPNGALALGLYWAHRYDEAIPEARRVIARDPNHWSGHLVFGLSLEQKHQFPQGMTELKKAMEVSNNRMWVCFLAHDMALS